MSTTGGRTPLWSRDGRELFYVASDGTLMGVRVERGSTWRSSVPETILTGSYYHSNAGSGRSYDIARDGRRFLMIRETEAVDSPRNLIVVQNWDQELKRLVPAD